MTIYDRRLIDADVRIENLFWIPGIVADAPKEFHDFIEDDIWDADRIKKVAPWIIEMTEDGADPDEIACQLADQGFTGFIAQLARPSPHKFSEDGRSYTSSWGLYRTDWFYAKTLDDLCSQAVQWSEGIVTAARERQKASAEHP